MKARPRAEDPQGGGRAKALGSRTGGRGSTPLSPNSSEINSQSPPADSGPLSGEYIPALSAGPPPAEAQVPAKRKDPAQDMAPSARWAGRDPKTGKVLPHTRSEKVAAVVAQYAAAGLGKNEIACLLNIRPGHLEQHYYRELHNGLNQTVAEVAGAMVERAKVPVLDATAQRAGEFILQARAGWRTGDQKQVLDAPMLNINIHL